MAATSFIKASDAAIIGGVSIAALGCSSGSEYPTKGGLVNSGGAFDLTRLENYDDEEFVLENDVVLGQILIELQVDASVQDLARVQLDGGTISDSVSGIRNLGDIVTAKCILNDASDVFLGWYDSDDQLVSSDINYAFSVQGDVALVAKVAYMSLSKQSLEFDALGGSEQIVISSNVDWSLS